MKSAQAWRLGMKDMQILPAPRQRGQLKKPTWIIVLVSLVSFFLVCAYVYPPQNSAACYVFSSHGCKAIQSWLPPSPARALTDDEIFSHVVIRDILNMSPTISRTPKIAFLFLTPGALPFEKLWDKFFQVLNCYLMLYLPIWIAGLSYNKLCLLLCHTDALNSRYELSATRRNVLWLKELEYFGLLMKETL